MLFTKKAIFSDHFQKNITTDVLYVQKQELLQKSSAMSGKKLLSRYCSGRNSFC